MAGRIAETSGGSGCSNRGESAERTSLAAENDLDHEQADRPDRDDHGVDPEDGRSGGGHDEVDSRLWRWAVEIVELDSARNAQETEGERNGPERDDGIEPGCDQPAVGESERDGSAAIRAGPDVRPVEELIATDRARLRRATRDQPSRQVARDGQNDQKPVERVTAGSWPAAAASFRLASAAASRKQRSRARRRPARSAHASGFARGRRCRPVSGSLGSVRDQAWGAWGIVVREPSMCRLRPRSARSGRWAGRSPWRSTSGEAP